MTRATLHVCAPTRIPGADAFVVVAAYAPHKPSIVDTRTPGRLSAMLSHDPGVSWPDRRGELLMNAVLHECGTIVLLFATLADAEGCFKKLCKVSSTRGRPVVV